MLLPLPGPLETTIPPRAGQRPTLATACVTVLAVAAILPVLGRLLAGRAWAEAPVRLAALVEASWTLYADPVLFQPWQLWSWVLAGGPLGMAVMDVLLVAVLVAAVERRIGAWWPTAAIAVLLPLGALLHLLLAPDLHVQAGSGGLVLALTGLAWGLLRPARLTMGLGWWAVVVAGWIPLGAIVLPWFGCLWAVLDGILHGPAVLVVDAVLLVMGAFIGAVLRLRVR